MNPTITKFPQKDIGQSGKSSAAKVEIKMKVGIAGAGNIAMACAAFLEHNGHAAYVWSPSGKRTQALEDGQPINVEGKIEGDFYPKVAASAKALAEADVIVLALPAYGHRHVLDALIPFIENRHTVIISGHLSFAALYLAKKLAERHIEIPVIAWSTTLSTSKPRGGPNQYLIRAIRSKIDMATMPAYLSDQALATCVALFGDRFDLKDDILTIALSNLNPEVHVSTCLCNLTRIERGEGWGQNTMETPALGQLTEDLDRERIALAEAFGKNVRTIFDHYRLSYNIIGNTVAEIASKQVAAGGDPSGPTNLSTRWVTEDAPYGIVPTLYLAELAGVGVPLHKSLLSIISSCYGRNFEADNDLLPEIGPLDMDTMARLMSVGYLDRRWATTTCDR